MTGDWLPLAWTTSTSTITANTWDWSNWSDDSTSGGTLHGKIQTAQLPSSEPKKKRAPRTALEWLDDRVEEYAEIGRMALP